jgi:hypothetical protein
VARALPKTCSALRGGRICPDTAEHKSNCDDHGLELPELARLSRYRNLSDGRFVGYRDACGIRRRRVGQPAIERTGRDAKR